MRKPESLITKIVNNISARLEMGSPMVAMYLLQNPDHYTNHDFAHVFWKNYVTEARRPWLPKDSEQEGENEKVALLRHKGKIIGLSPVLDYICRPVELEDMCLYDWIRRCSRIKVRCKKEQELVVVEEEEEANAKVNLTSEEADETVEDDESESEVESESHLEDGESSSNMSSAQASPLSKPKFDLSQGGTFDLLNNHPLHKTHKIQCVPETKALIPNFIGETLPRRDRGDREWYCTTMLTLFCSWRSGLDLKKSTQSWDEKFLSHTFSKRQEEVMNNFNLRYECLDARDDFHSKLQKDDSIIPSWGNFSSSGNDNDNTDGIELGNDDDGCTTHEFDMDVTSIGKCETKRQHEMASMKSIMQQTGWTEALASKSLASRPPPTVSKTGAQWKADVKQMRQSILDKTYKSNSSDELAKTEEVSGIQIDHAANQVKIVDKSYLECKLHSMVHKQVIDPIVKKFDLNKEQQRAFRIVANHACSSYSEQLKMYIGGMGGTGKTQVLKALMEFFELTNQSEKFVVVAPTGTAAALLGGSTYHYLFGFGDRPDDNVPPQLLIQLRARFEGVKYIFLDEVSMLSCHDMYRISVRLAKILNVADLPFGGMNMLFAGDFAQLPPAIGQEHTALYSRTVGSKSTNLRDQEAAVGKALWQQITTVVILRQNMRQRHQSKEDTALREALTNMRYKACTPEDIAFLRSRVSSAIPGRPAITQENFRSVSIITALNVHKDEINRLGSLRYAKETSQDLCDFFSEDTVSSSAELKPGKQRFPRKR